MNKVLPAKEGKSKFILLYHRTPFEESINEHGARIWVDQKSPNGIIPTLRNIFHDKPNGTWIAWKEVERIENEKS